MELLIYSQEVGLKGMRAIDLDFIQKLIRSMSPTEEGKIHTHMVSDDYCKRALISGLDNFAVITLPTESYLILLSISSYYHARIYYEDLSFFKAIVLCTDSDSHIDLVNQELKSYPNLIVPADTDLDFINTKTTRKNSYSNIFRVYRKTLLFQNGNKKIQFVKDDNLVEAINSGGSLAHGYMAINIAKNYEVPITTISEESPGIVL